MNSDFSAMPRIIAGNHFLKILSVYRVFLERPNHLTLTISLLAVAI
jgi:hypothetical protein